MKAAIGERVPTSPHTLFHATRQHLRVEEPAERWDEQELCSCCGQVLSVQRNRPLDILRDKDSYCIPLGIRPGKAPCSPRTCKRTPSIGIVWIFPCRRLELCNASKRFVWPKRRTGSTKIKVVSFNTGRATLSDVLSLFRQEL